MVADWPSAVTLTVISELLALCRLGYPHGHAELTAPEAVSVRHRLICDAREGVRVPLATGVPSLLHVTLNLTLNAFPALGCAGWAIGFPITGLTTTGVPGLVGETRAAIRACWSSGRATIWVLRARLTRRLYEGEHISVAPEHPVVAVADADD